MPGCRVKVRFAGQDVDGFLLSGRAEHRPPGPARAAAPGGQRRAGAQPAVARPGRRRGRALRRHPRRRAAARRAAAARDHRASRAHPARDPPRPSTRAARAPPGRDHPAAGGLPRATLAAGESPRAVWATPPGRATGRCWSPTPPRRRTPGRAAGCSSACPTPRTSTGSRRALTAVLGDGHHVDADRRPRPGARATATSSPSRAGRGRVVVGTRAAAFAPVHDLGLVVLWDDGDDLYAEPRAPYPHTREMLLLRAEREGTAALLGGFARTVEAEHAGAHRLGPRARRCRASVLRERVTVQRRRRQRRRAGPRPARPRSRGCRRRSTTRSATGSRAGPVLVQTPRLGYAAALACERCRTAGALPRCQGPLALPGRRSAAALPLVRHRPAAAGPAASAATAGCGRRSSATRAPPRSSAAPSRRRRCGRRRPATRVLAEVGPEPAIVVATPGAEPVAEGGYAAVVLLDTWLMLARPDLRTAEEAVRRWANAVGLVRPGGRAVGGGRPCRPGACRRWCAGTRRLRRARGEPSAPTAHLPPASRLATITGEPGRRRRRRSPCSPLPAGAEVLGPVPVGGDR